MKNKSFWKFTDNFGTFIAENIQKIPCLYFPLANEAEMMSSITPDLKGDIKTDNNSFLMLPISRQDLSSSQSSRNFWLYTDKGAWSIAQAIEDNRKDNLMLEGGFLYHKLIKTNTRLGLKATLTNFVPTINDHVELMLIEITNISNSPIEITTTSAIPIYGRSADNLRDHRHVTSLLHRTEQNKYGVIVQPIMSFDERGHKINDTCYYVLGFDGNNQAPVGSFPTQEKFQGEDFNLNRPLAVFKNLAPNKLPQEELSGKEAIGALRFKTKKLKPRESAYFVLLLGIADTKKYISKTFKKFNSINKIKKNKSLKS